MLIRFKYKFAAAAVIFTLLFALPLLAATGIFAAKTARAVSDGEWDAFCELYLAANTAVDTNRYSASGELRLLSSIGILKDFTIEGPEGDPAVFVFDPAETDYFESDFDKYILDGYHSNKPDGRHLELDVGPRLKNKNIFNITVTIRNIIFRSNTGFGGINVQPSEGCTVNLILENCIFEELGDENVFGGAVRCAAGHGSNPNFYGNNSSFNLVAKDCVFTGNKGDKGGAAFLYVDPRNTAQNSAAAAFINCVFTDNISNVHQGPFYSSGLTSFVNLRIDAGGGDLPDGWIDELLSDNFSTLPSPVKEGYAFMGWHENNTLVRELSINPGKLYYEGILAAVWEKLPEPFTPDSLPPKPFPAWGTALIAVGSAAVIGAGIFAFFFLRRRKLALAAANNAPVQAAPPVLGAEGLDELAKRCGLTAREKEVTELIIGGKSHAAIAHELFISRETVKTHVRNLYEKLGVSSKYELFAKLKK